MIDEDPFLFPTSPSEIRPDRDGVDELNIRCNRVATRNGRSFESCAYNDEPWTIFLGNCVRYVLLLRGRKLRSPDVVLNESTEIKDHGK